MRLLPTLVAVVLVIAPLPVLASSCAEQIGTIERRLDSAGAVLVSGLKAGHTLTTGSPRAVTTVRLDALSDPDTVSTAGQIEGALVLMIRATDEDQRDDKRACEHTMTDAKGMTGALP